MVTYDPGEVDRPDHSGLCTSPKEPGSSKHWGQQMRNKETTNGANVLLEAHFDSPSLGVSRFLPNADINYGSVTYAVKLGGGGCWSSKAGKDSNRKNVGTTLTDHMFQIYVPPFSSLSHTFLSRWGCLSWGPFGLLSCTPAPLVARGQNDAFLQLEGAHSSRGRHPEEGPKRSSGASPESPARIGGQRLGAMSTPDESLFDHTSSLHRNNDAGQHL